MSTVNCKVKNMEGLEVGSIDLDPAVFAGTVNEALVHDVVTWQRSKARAGTHATLNRAKIQVTGKKMYKQKGTGRARHASYGSPIFVGGAVAFGPQPRSYEKSMNRRARKQALVSALTDKVARDRLVILDDMTTDGKTRTFASALKKLGLGTTKSLVVIGPDEHATERSARNLGRVLTSKLEGVNVYDLLKYPYLVLSRATVMNLQERIKGMK